MNIWNWLKVLFINLKPPEEWADLLPKDTHNVVSLEERRRNKPPLVTVMGDLCPPEVSALEMEDALSRMTGKTCSVLGTHVNVRSGSAARLTVSFALDETIGEIAAFINLQKVKECSVETRGIFNPKNPQPVEIPYSDIELSEEETPGDYERMVGRTHRKGQA